MAEPDFFNVFTAQYERMTADIWDDTEVAGRILFESPDRSHLVVASRYPDGVRFRYGADLDYLEVFYVVAGSGSRTYGDGATVAMNAGDVIFVRPGVDIDYVYEPGFVDLAFFWSHDGPLPDGLTTGIADRGLSR